MKLEQELRLRKLARTLARAIVALFCIAFLAALFASVAEHPVLRTALVALLSVLATMGLIVFIVWAAGARNKQRIEELEKRLEKR